MRVPARSVYTKVCAGWLPSVELYIASEFKGRYGAKIISTTEVAGSESGGSHRTKEVLNSR